MTISQALLPEFDEEMKNTRKLVECIPDSKLNYRPHPKSMTLAQLATHVVDIAGWANSALDLTVLDIPADYKPHIAESRAELLEIFDKNVSSSRTKIAAATDEDWAAVWTFKMAGQTILSMPRASVMRSLVMNHLIHHRAQLGVFLRLNDVAIPGMYGPSADEVASAQTA